MALMSAARIAHVVFVASRVLRDTRVTTARLFPVSKCMGEIACRVMCSHMEYELEAATV